MDKKRVTVALAGNANVGKSVIFNKLTGLHQHVGNWPGKTVERAEGTLSYRDHQIDVVDLPGIYSLSTYSIEEVISREYIAVEHPDVLVNVVDASSLERNLAFTVQLLELRPHMIVALNQIDIAENKGIKVDVEKLSEALGVPVVPTIAIQGTGLTELMDQVIETAYADKKAEPIPYGVEVERIVQGLAETFTFETPYPGRWLAVKLLEGDAEITEMVLGLCPGVDLAVSEARERVEEIHGHGAGSVIASERYIIAQRVASEVSTVTEPEKGVRARLAELTTHPVLGYVFMIVSIAAVFLSIFRFGDWLAAVFEVVFEAIKAGYFNLLGSGALASFVWNAVLDGFFGGLSVAIPFIMPFYLVLSVLEDSGYLARVAFLMDSLMHSIGLHGKGFIPIMLGFGCNVPAVLGCRVMETERERLLCAFVASLVPCAARSMVIYGLVGAYVGLRWALLLYVIDFALILVLGRLAFKVAPDEPVGLIMEMPGYRMPSLKVTSQRTWFRLRGFIYEAFPIIILGSFVIHLAQLVGLLDLVQELLSPVTIGWLGLPAVTGVVLIFGVLRKELTLILLASVMGSPDFSAFLSPLQMFVFSFVVMVYVPCISTIAALAKEFGARKAASISIVQVLVAVLLGGVIYRVLLFLGLP